MSDKSVVAKEITPAKSAQIFAERYQELVKEQGFQIAAVPQWVQSKDTGDYRLAVQLTVVEYKES